MNKYRNLLAILFAHRTKFESQYIHKTNIPYGGNEKKLDHFLCVIFRIDNLLLSVDAKCPRFHVMIDVEFPVIPYSNDTSNL